MQIYLTMAANRAVDDYAINRCGIPGHTLMLNAGMAVVEQMEHYGFLTHAPKVLVLAGHGNNGGDGFVIAAGLAAKGLQVAILMAAHHQRLKGDALHHFDQLKDQDVEVQTWADDPEQARLISEAGLIVDALLGTGIEGSIRSPYETLIKLVNQSPAHVIAVDVPSGVTGDKGAVLDPCIAASLTVSMGFGKQGCLFEPARSHAGTIVVVDIGFPEDSLAHVEGPALEQNDTGDYPPANFSRLSHTHKYTAGKVFIVAGSRGYTGAALLSSTAALRSGAGLVRLATPGSLGPIMESRSMETIIDYVDETQNAGIAASAWPQIAAGCDWADTVVVGPGLGRDPETQEIVKKIMVETTKPIVLDADALFALSMDTSLLRSRKGPTVLTPHGGEFKRLLERSDPTPTWRDARDFATKFEVSLLLKGAPSLMATPTGRIIINSSGYAGMATAGSGDVLSGVIGSLWAQWPDHPNVLDFAMFIHGHAAELKRPSKGVLGLIAGDIVEALPEALKEYGDLPY